MDNLNEVEILIVEDNPNDAEMALRAMKKNNIANHVMVVNNGEEALDFIFTRGGFADREKCSHPKLILLDLNLPKMSGLDVLKEIKNNPKTKIIPVVMMTSSKEETDIVRSYELGVNSYIVKPVNFDKFVEAVHELGFYWLLLNTQAR
jgi:CheY-like chemotaxis protein